jgi:hypothetical protein
MKKFLFLIIIVFLLSSLSITHATVINDPWSSSDSHEKNLYSIYNDHVGTSYTSSNDLYDQHGVSFDTTWNKRFSSMDILGKFAGYSHRLGYTTQGSSNVQWVVSSSTNGYFSNISSAVTDRSFLPSHRSLNWILGYKAHDGTTGMWSSNEDRNWDNFNHLMVFEITDSEWLFAFEDLAGGGDMDFNDLVFTATASELSDVPLANTPEPSTMLLFGTGLLSMAAIGRWKLKRKQ